MSTRDMTGPEVKAQGWLLEAGHHYRCLCLRALRKSLTLQAYCREESMVTVCKGLICFNSRKEIIYGMLTAGGGER